MLSKHARAPELNRWLISFKDFFLLGFFLSIGMIGLPTWEQIYLALGISLFLPIRFIIYFFLFNRSRMRNRNSVLAGSALSNFSEFGLIVCSFAVGKGLLDGSWLTTLALVLSFSFIFSALFSSYAEKIYMRFAKRLEPFQRKELHPQEQDINFEGYNVLVIGMGRVGHGAYKYFDNHKKLKPLAIEISSDVIEELKEEEFNIVQGNATSPDFWQRVKIKKTSIELVLLAMPLVRQNCLTAKFIRSQGFKGNISSIAKYPNEEGPLKEHGVDSVFNLYAEAGNGFAQSACS